MAERMEIDPERTERRKAFLELGGGDIEIIRDLHERLGDRRLEFADDFYAHLLAFDETRRLVGDPAILDRLKSTQAAYFSRLTAGTYDRDYVLNRLRVGVVHQRVGLEPQLYMAAYRKYLCWLLPVVSEIFRQDPDRAVAAYRSLLKVVFFDMGLAIDTYVYADREALRAAKSRAEEERLRAQQAYTYELRFRELLEHATDGIVMMDEQGLVTDFNRAAEKMFGYASDEVLGRPITMLMPEAQRRQHEAGIRRYVQTGQSAMLGVVRQVQGLRRDGTTLSIECVISACRVRGELIFTGILRDVSDRHRAEQALKRSERSFRMLIEQTPDAIAVHRDGCFVYVNPSMVRLLGYRSRDELVGEPLAMTVHPGDRAAVVERFRATVASGDLAPPREERWLRKDGSIIWAEVVAMPVEYEGEPAMVAIGRDLTERKELAARMMQMDRMIAVGTLAAGVGHEINNPLTYMNANVVFALEHIGTLRAFAESVDAEIRERFGEETADEVLAAAGGSRARTTIRDLEEMLGDARDGSERIRDIVRDLKTISRGDDEKREPLLVHRVIRSAVDMAFNEIRHRANLVKDFGQIPPVVGNDNRLGQVFLNLLVNAAHAIDEGAADRNEIRIHTSLRGGEVSIEVRDSGKGIPAEDLPRLFDPFFTTKPVGQGTGLGLSICRQIVESHGGRIEVESEPGKGSVFRVLLPPAPEEVRTTAPAPAGPSIAGRRGRLLVVDDEPLIGRIMQRTLGGEHHLEAVTTGRAVLDRLAAGERFDLIFCDLMMPEMTGMELHEAVRKLVPDQARRMIFMTGGAFTPRARDFLDRTPNLQLEKPFDARNLRALVRDLLRGIVRQKGDGEG